MACLHVDLKTNLMKVDIFDLFSKFTFAIGEICGMPGMKFLGTPIPPRCCTIVVIGIKKRAVKLPFPTLIGTKVKDMENGIVLWF